MHPPSVVDPVVDARRSRAPRPAHGPASSSAARGGTPARRPVWFMRQAGRSLPEYRALRAGTAMLQACLDPDAGLRDHAAAGAAARRRRRDPVLRHRRAAVRGRGRTSTSCPAPGRWSPRPVRTARRRRAPARRWSPEQVAPVAEAVGLLLRELGDTPLIGFAGAPFTLASYLVEGGPAATTSAPRRSCTPSPSVWHALLGRLAELTRDVPAGAGRGRGRRGAALRLLGGRAVRARTTAGSSCRTPRACSTAVADAGRAADPLRRRHRRAARGDGGGGRRRRRRRLAGAARRGRPPHRPAPVQGNLDPAVLFADRASIEAEVRRILERGPAARRARVQPRPRRAARHRPGRPHPAGRAGAQRGADERARGSPSSGRAIAGLAAAHRPARRCSAPKPRSRVLEQRDRIGGVLRTVDLAGRPYDVGAEAFLAPAARGAGAAGRARAGRPARATRRGRTRRSARRGARWRCPAARCWACRRARPGWPGCCRTPGSRRWRPRPRRPLAWSPGGDVALGRLLRARFGDELTDRLVDPLLGGVYAGRVDASACGHDARARRGARRGRDLADRRRRRRRDGAAQAPLPPGTESRRRRRPAGIPDSPCETRDSLFGGLRGGYRVLLDALADAARADLRLGTTVRAIEPSAAGWLLRARPDDRARGARGRRGGAGRARARGRAAAPAGRPGRGGRGGGHRAGVVAWSWRWPSARRRPARPTTSGALVAAGEPLSVKGVTHSSTKWAHLGGDGLVRAAGLARPVRRGRRAAGRRRHAGRAGAGRPAPCSTGIRAAPVAVHVQRWGGGLPQYAPGHVGRVATLEGGPARRDRRRGRRAARRRGARVRRHGPRRGRTPRAAAVVRIG